MLFHSYVSLPEGNDYFFLWEFTEGIPGFPPSPQEHSAEPRNLVHDFPVIGIGMAVCTLYHLVRFGSHWCFLMCGDNLDRNMLLGESRRSILNEFDVIF